MIILDLCGGTGSWSQPYAKAGYDVRVVTLPESDVRDYEPPLDVRGVLAAPPCTDLAGSGARWWAAKGERAYLDAIGIVAACLRIIDGCQPAWWCLENPVGRLPRFLGKPVMYFQPWEYGDPYTKKTALWGKFMVPKQDRVLPLFGSMMHVLPPSAERRVLRSITPAGFAQAFFEANP